MITFYAALGRYKQIKDYHGEKCSVIVTGDGNEHITDIQELIIWTCLLWNIQTYDELKKSYLQESKKLGVCVESFFNSYLDRMLQRGLIMEGKDIVGIDAVYNLFSRLYVIPIPNPWFVRTINFVKMIFSGVSFHNARKRTKIKGLSNDESMVMKIASQQLISTAEIIRCIEKGITKLSSEAMLVDMLYDDDTTTSDNIDLSSRHLSKKGPVIKAISGLYQKRQVILEKAF